MESNPCFRFQESTSIRSKLSTEGQELQSTLLKWTLSRGQRENSVPMGGRKSSAFCRDQHEFRFCGFQERSKLILYNEQGEEKQKRENWQRWMSQKLQKTERLFVLDTQILSWRAPVITKVPWELTCFKVRYCKSWRETLFQLTIIFNGKKEA